MWSGIDTAAVAMIGVVAFNESVSEVKILGIPLIIGGAVVLNLAGAH